MRNSEIMKKRMGFLLIEKCVNGKMIEKNCGKNYNRFNFVKRMLYTFYQHKRFYFF